MSLNSIQQSSQAQFDRQSDRYGKNHILADISDVEAAFHWIVQPTNPTALDIATGGGHTGLCLASRGYRVTLADISSAMLTNAVKLAGERGLTVETRQHPAEELPYPDTSFDLVSCRVAAHHFHDKGAAEGR